MFGTIACMYEGPGTHLSLAHESGSNWWSFKDDLLTSRNTFNGECQVLATDVHLLCFGRFFYG